MAPEVSGRTRGDWKGVQMDRIVGARIADIFRRNMVDFKMTRSDHDQITYDVPGGAS